MANTPNRTTKKSVAPAEICGCSAGDILCIGILKTDMPDVCMKQNWGNSQLLCFLLPLWYNPGKVVINMDTKEILLELRTKRGLSQEQLAEQVHVTRQAVSRWEQEAAYPETEKLSLLSQALDLSLDELSLGGCVGGAKPSSCGKLRMPEAETGAFQGALIKESLKDDTVLDFVGICGVELWQTQDTPRYWTAITFVSQRCDLPSQVQKSLLKGWRQR